MSGCFTDWIVGLGLCGFFGGLITGNWAVAACGGATVAIMAAYWIWLYPPR